VNAKKPLAIVIRLLLLELDANDERWLSKSCEQPSNLKKPTRAAVHTNNSAKSIFNNLSADQSTKS